MRSQTAPIRLFDRLAQRRRLIIRLGIFENLPRPTLSDEPKLAKGCGAPPRLGRMVEGQAGGLVANRDRNGRDWQLGFPPATEEDDS